MLLWQRVRDVRLWATVPEEAHTGLFVGQETVESTLEAAEALAVGLTAPLRALAALVRFPEYVDRRDLSAACLTISEWAESSHMPETALHFAEAAALTDPMSARASAAAGSACAQQAADQRAELWFLRAICIARRTRDWEWHARAYIRLGMLFYELGDLGRARRAYERARSSAKWSGHYSYAAKAHHDLLLLECAVGTYEGGDQHARRALELYPTQFPRLPHLAHDFAYLLTCHGAFVDALEVLDAALPFFARPWERVAIMGTIAKAAAGVDLRDRHNEAVADLLLLATVAETHAAAALVLAAEGAHLLQEWERARRLAEYGLEVAERRHERDPQRRARRVLELVMEHRPETPIRPLSSKERVASTKALFLKRLRDLRASAAETGTHTELAHFTMSGRL
ncbi:MAG TPA: hypothetical protein VHG28_11685 [Longimicrobiaceae bacterium]|nr:hypothetical protein [Longimicrobiaceae bacterium]